MDLQQDSMRAQLEHFVAKRDIEQLKILLVHFEGDDLAHQFQRAYRISLEQDHLKSFIEFYLLRKSGKRVLPDKKLLMRAATLVISQHVKARDEHDQNQDVRGEHLKVLFEMMVYAEMSIEFLELYKDLTFFAPLPAQCEPESPVLYAALHIVKQSVTQAKNGEDLKKYLKAQSSIHELFKL